MSNIFLTFFMKIERKMLMKIATSRLTIKGQVTIPKEIRTHLRLKEGETVCFSINEKDEVVLTRANVKLSCPVCERGFIKSLIDKELMKCPLCQGTEIVNCQSVSDWVKMAVDVAALLGMDYDLHRNGSTYQLMYDVTGLDFEDRALVEQFQQFIQSHLKEN